MLLIHFISPLVGGGAYKYAELIKDKLHTELIREDEMETVVSVLLCPITSSDHHADHGDELFAP
jgi:pantothenate kinase